MSIMSYKTVNAAYVNLCDYVQYGGIEQPSRNGVNKEIHPMAFGVENYENYYLTVSGRVMNFPFSLIELWYLVTGQNDDQMVKYNKQVENYLDFFNTRDGRKQQGWYNASYGNRMLFAHGIDQLKDVVNHLTISPDSRHAGITYRHPSMDRALKETNDRACNIHSMFLIRDGKLDITQIVRSQDIIWGLPYNFAQFGYITQTIAEKLGVPIGSYYEMVNSLHVYEPFYEDLAIIENNNFDGKDWKPPEIGKVNYIQIASQIDKIESAYDKQSFLVMNSIESPFWRDALWVLCAYWDKKKQRTPREGNKEVMIRLEEVENELFKYMALRYFCEYYKGFADQLFNLRPDLAQILTGENN